MIELVYGGEGSGKTATLVKMANTNAEKAKGIHVYIDKSNSRMHDLEHSVKLVDATEYLLDGSKQLMAFVLGITAGNYDVETIYIDNIEKITKENLSQMEEAFIGMERASQLTGVRFVITALGERKDLPEYMDKYLTE